ncbi:hypothetical protein ACX6XY_05575 [Streptomyces sp. O3]
MSRYAKALSSLATVALMTVGGLAIAPAAQAAPAPAAQTQATQTQAAPTASGTWVYYGSYNNKYDTCMEAGKSYAKYFGYKGYKCVSYPHHGYVEWRLYLLR